MVEIVEAISRELGSTDEVTLDVDILATALQPAQALPDPAVDRYRPVEEKLTQAIYEFKLAVADPSTRRGCPAGKSHPAPPGHRHVAGRGGGQAQTVYVRANKWPEA